MFDILINEGWDRIISKNDRMIHETNPEIKLILCIFHLSFKQYSFLFSS